MTSKEALEDIILYLNANEPKGLYCENIEVIKKGLERLEVIDNANPSEALKCLAGLEKEITQRDGYITNFLKIKFDIIKATLLKAQEQEKENELLKEIIKSLFDKGCPLHQYMDNKFGLTIEVDDECSIMQLGEFKGVNLDKKLKEVLEDES